MIQSPLGFEGKGSVTLPDEVTLSARQALHGPLDAAWHGRVAESKAAWGIYPLLAALSAAPAEFAKPSTSITMTNGYFALGAEYAYSPSLTVRTGVNYEISPC